MQTGFAIVKTKRRKRERERNEETVLRATRKQSSSLSFLLDRPRRCPAFLLLLFRSLLPSCSPGSSSSRFSFHHPRLLLLLYATSATPCNIYEIGDLSPTTTKSSFLLPFFLSFSDLVFRVVRRGRESRCREGRPFHGFLRKHGRDSASDLHYQRESW